MICAVGPSVHIPLIDRGSFHKILTEGLRYLIVGSAFHKILTKGLRYLIVNYICLCLGLVYTVAMGVSDIIIYVHTCKYRLLG